MIRRELPIIFTAESVNAILAGRKVQTRRLMNPQPKNRIVRCVQEHPGERCKWYDADGVNPGVEVRPRFLPGDRIWVKEAWGLHRNCDETDWLRGSLEGMSRDDVLTYWSLAFRADWGPNQEACFWRSPLYMPRWASRISLEVTEVRAQRVQEISEEDARAEGMESVPTNHGHDAPLSFVADFEWTWDRINGKRSPWSRNDFVFAYTFRRIKP